MLFFRRNHPISIAEPVLWAANHNPVITDGTSETTFSPNDPCTRGQIVTFLYRDMGE